MALLALKDLRRYVVGRTADSALTFAIKLQLSCQAEVSDLDFHLVIDEEVTKFEVAVDDSVAVHVLNR